MSTPSYFDAWFITPGEITATNIVKIFEFDGKKVFHGRFDVEQEAMARSYKYYVSDSYIGLLVAEPSLAKAVFNEETGEWEPIPEHKWFE